MLSGHLQGRVLSMLSHMIKPARILEIGTYTGYAAICLAEGMQEGGSLDTIDINEELEPMVRRYIALSGNEGRIHFHSGHALEVLKTLNGPFDLVFVDADKTNYLAYYDAIWPKMPVGAYLIADNVLWSGKVVDTQEIEKDPETAALALFNTFVHKDPRAAHVLFPIRDGLMVVRKISD